MKRLVILVTAFSAGCGGVGTRPPALDDPIGAGMPSLPAQSVLLDEAAAEKLLEEYTGRLAQGLPIYPGDKLRFLVVGNAELSFATFVPAEGEINYPHVGTLRLAGRTLQDVRTELKKKLSDGYLINPDVSVYIDDYARKVVSLLGAVEHPKDYDIPSGRLTTLLQVVSQAGGFRADAEKRAVVVLRRRDVGSTDKVAFCVDTVALTRAGRGRDPVVLPDDVIFVPARERVYVLGQVHRPGDYVAPADTATSVSQAIALAGGFTRIAKESGVQLIRRHKDGTKKAYTINVARILGGHPEEDVPLQPGDVIFVPESFF
jgi:polysaccharide export outer membrane protein